MQTTIPAAMLLGLAAALGAAAQSPQLPAAYATPSVNNSSRVIPAPASWRPAVSAGFTVSTYAKSLRRPRWLAVAPNGDVFVAETLPQGDVLVLHGGASADGRTTFADQLRQPFGLAFHGEYVYIGDNDEVVRFRYDPKT
ncbi:MAG: hypothetical protein ACRD1E_00915, partial [Terriglobales bacterium]